MGRGDAVQGLGDDVLRLVDQLLHVSSAQVESLELLDWLFLRDLALDLDIWGLRLTSGHQPLMDEEVVHKRAYQRPDNWSDDWEPPVPVDVAVVPRQRHSVPAGEPGEKPRAEVAGRIDRVTRIRAEGHPDPRHE